jgi:hypothetical protein
MSELKHLTTGDIGVIVAPLGEGGKSGVATGTNTYALTLSPSITAYAIGQVIDVIFTNANTITSTINIDTLGAKAIKKNGDKSIKEGDIRAGQAYSLVYDGTDFQIIGRVTTDWSPTAISLGSAVLSGATRGNNIGAGNYVTFDNTSDDEILFNIALARNNQPYSGVDLIVTLDWMKYGASGGIVLWELDYAFIEIGNDAYSKLDGTITESVNVTAVTDQSIVLSTLTIPGGSVDARILQLTLRRNAIGVGSDTYSGDAELYGFNLGV